MHHNKVHFHILTASNIMGVNIEISEDYDNSRKLFRETVQTVKDSTGSEISQKEENIVRFENGDKVRWRPCDRDCVVNNVQHKDLLR